MRVLIIKMSSLGDVVHTLPAITDACNNIPGIRFDWVVEEAFAEIPAWHPGVNKVIPIAWRRWRKSLGSLKTRQELRAFLHSLREHDYDAVLDAQGLIKSALVTFLTRGKRYGMDRTSARESLAALFYNNKFAVPKGQHAILRLRQLFATCLDYTLPNSLLDYGIDKRRWQTTQDRRYVVFLHGTTWITKLWPESYWQSLTAIAGSAGYDVHIPWGSDEEHARARRIAGEHSNAKVLPKLSLAMLASELCNASAVIGVDSGLTHIAAALNVPTYAIYGSTDPDLTGVLGGNVYLQRSTYACSPCLLKTCQFPQTGPIHPPCYEELSPDRLWQQVSLALQ